MLSGNKGCRRNTGYTVPQHQDETGFAHSDRLLRKLAHQGKKRLDKAGVPVEFEDVLQEVYVTWLNAREHFDPDSGNRFSTYLVTAVRNNFNKFAAQLEQESTKLGVADLDEAFIENCPDSAATTPEEDLALNEAFSGRYLALSDDAQVILDWMQDPPEFVLQEVRAKRSKVGRARAMGEDRHAETDLTLRLAINLYARIVGYGRSRTDALRQELTRFVSQF